MRAAPILTKPLVAVKPKLKLPAPRAPFRVHLEHAEAPPPPPALEHRPRARTPVAAPTSKRAPRERDEPLPELDSAARTATLLAPPAHVVTAAAPPPPLPATPPAIAQQLAVELVEKAAFWGDGTRGVARLRLNGRARAGLANATITLEHDGDEMHLRVDGVDEETEQQLRERLAQRGVTLSGDS